MSSSSTAFENGLACAINPGIEEVPPPPNCRSNEVVTKLATGAITIGFTFLVKSRRPTSGAGVFAGRATAKLAQDVRSPQAEPQAAHTLPRIPTTTPEHCGRAVKTVTNSGGERHARAHCGYCLRAPSR